MDELGIQDWQLPDDIWDIGIYDAHCHPVDNYKKLPAGLKNLRTSKLTVMATRLDDQHKVHEAALQFPDRVVPSFGKYCRFDFEIFKG